MNTIYTDIGHIKLTKGQIKKHRSQMTQGELGMLNGCLKGLKLIPTQHCMERESITCSHIRNAIKSYNIVEYNYNFSSGQSRVLIRSKNKEVLTDGLEYNLCLVIAIATGHIVTMYWNLDRDKHETINLTRYMDFEIEKYIL